MDIKLIHLEFQFPLNLLVLIYEKWNVNLFNKTFGGMRKVRYKCRKKVNNLQHYNYGLIFAITTGIY